MLSEAERSLLLLCARQTLSSDLTERAAEILRASPAREELVATAWRHGVAPLLFRHLQASSGADRFGPEGLHLLRQYYVRSAFRAGTHYAALTQILERAAASRIEIVLLKGAALARTLYQDQALRPFADIDLLVPEEQTEEARQMLISLGYKSAPELLSEKFNRRYHSNLPLVRLQPQPIHIELHWRLSDPFSLIAFDHAALIARCERVNLGPGLAQVLAREDHFVYLCAHLDNHGYLNRAMVERDWAREFSLHELSGNRLIWFTDLHEWAEGSLAWEKVLDAARAAGASDALAVSLRLLRSLLGTMIPTSVFQALPLPEVPWPERKVATRVISLAKKNDRSEMERFQRRFLATHKGFELRLIRVMDIWQYVFPPRPSVRRSYCAHVMAATFFCGQMLLELLYRRALRRMRGAGLS